ncbi:MAG: TIGR00730 family Rossman fold protein [Bdellovibrionales bacterium]|nr:TIGR00730 family Rossman fold protein [Bdellovibrionales bacterium]
MSSVCVFCSASETASPFFFAEIEILGKLLAEEGIDVWCGGASVGLMGRLADGVIKSGGRVRGVMPRVFQTKEMVYPGLTEMIYVDTLVERKRVMLESADAFIGFPGGVGTLDEIMEVMAHRQLGLSDKPLILVNTLDFWRSFLDCLVEMQQQHMIPVALEELCTVVDQPQDVIKVLRSHRLVD